MPSPTDSAAAIETAGVEVDQGESIADVIRDLEIQKNRLKAVADASQAEGGVPLEAVAVMRELQSTILPLLMDVVKFTDRLEEHAEWASQQISDLQGETETASQITSNDASQLRDFLVEVGTALAAAQTLLPDSEVRDQCPALALRATELVKLIDDIELEDVDEDEDGDDDNDNDDNAETPPAPPPLAAVPTEPAPPIGEFPPES